MNALVQANPVLGVMPTSMGEAIQFAEMMARGKLVPEHLQKSAGDCFLVVEQSLRWHMSPFAVAACTSVVHGRLFFEGKLVAAAVQSSGVLATRFSYIHDGAGDDRAVTVSATVAGEADPRTVRIVLRDVRTKTKTGEWNRQWTGGQIDQQLCYAGTRVWARRHTPEVMLGVYSPEEFDQPAQPVSPAFEGTTLDAKAEPAPELEPAPVPTKKSAAREGAVAEELIARFGAVMTRKEHLAVVDDTECRDKLKWFHDRRPALFEKINAALRDSWARTELPDTFDPEQDAGVIAEQEAAV